MAIQTKRERDLEDALKEAGNDAPIQEVTELGAVMDNLDNDTQDVKTKMSNIDFNTRLSKDEINCIMVIDELTRLGILPEDIGITRQKKRLSVSLKGEGRKEKVAIVQGEREHRGGRGIGEKLKGLFTRN